VAGLRILPLSDEQMSIVEETLANIEEAKSNICIAKEFWNSNRFR
jgi:hypothetical protein